MLKKTFGDSKIQTAKKSVSIVCEIAEKKSKLTGRSKVFKNEVQFNEYYNFLLEKKRG